MKPIHKEIIDAVFTQLMNGTPSQLYAVMETDWERFTPTLATLATVGSEPKQEEAPSQEATPAEESSPTSNPSTPPQHDDSATESAPTPPPIAVDKIDDLVEKAKYLFGPEHVTVLE